jgi:hypothetical protein
VVIRHVHLLHDLAGAVGLHQLRGERPEDRILVIGADALKVVRVRSLAGDGLEVGGEGGGREKEEGGQENESLLHDNACNSR